jgi:MarR family transcriptional regulator, transcriptional regulator for hemolysin
MKLNIRDEQEGNETSLIHDLAKQFVRRFDNRARAMGLTRIQWRLLRVLHRHPGLRQTDLAEQLDIAPMSLVHLLNRMEKKKWCRRVDDEKDKRVKRVYLCARVSPYTRKMRTLALSLRKKALRGFSRREHKELVAFLTRIVDNLGSSPSPSHRRSHHE